MVIAVVFGFNIDGPGVVECGDAKFGDDEDVDVLGDVLVATVVEVDDGVGVDDDDATGGRIEVDGVEVDGVVCDRDVLVLVADTVGEAAEPNSVIGSV